jgi:tetratricopeptide (TPR) repeat protein
MPDNVAAERRPRRASPSPRPGRAPSSRGDGDRPTSWLVRRPLLTLSIAILLVYVRIFSAGFVVFDDDVHVYANPFLNPPTLESVARLWQHAYEQLYVPLAYTIFAVIARFALVPAHMDSSLGAQISLGPTAFHVVSVALHLANAWLCFSLVRRLTGRARVALLSALLFALHPLQLESVGWISELRGVTSGVFGLLALNAFALSRQTSAQAGSRKLLAASALLVLCATLCKPSAVVLPVAALAIDRIVFRSPWRKALAAASLWGAVALPFVVITRAIQSVPAAGQSLWWQRPFIAGDALAFYLFKIFVPIDLGVDYGRTPHAVMSHGWGYLTWAIPIALLALAFRNRLRRPFTWLGALLFVTFLLPTLGLAPFSYQAYSTVADRYVYLALLGVGLMVADTFDHLNARRHPLLCAATVLIVLAALSFNQSRTWLTSADFLHHALDINPAAGFAYNNLGNVALANGDLPAALADYQACLEHDRTHAKVRINLAEVYTALNRPAEAERASAAAEKVPEMTSDDLSNLGIVLMKMNQPDRALQALAAAVAADPDSPSYLFNQANALAAVGQFEQAEAAFRRSIALAPTLAGAHTGLGIVLAETGRLPDAIAEFRQAVHLQPDDPAALDDLKKAEQLRDQPQAP